LLSALGSFALFDSTSLLLGRLLVSFGLCACHFLLGLLLLRLGLLFRRLFLSSSLLLGLLLLRSSSYACGFLFLSLGLLFFGLLLSLNTLLLFFSLFLGLGAFLGFKLLCCFLGFLLVSLVVGYLLFGCLLFLFLRLVAVLLARGNWFLNDLFCKLNRIVSIDIRRQQYTPRMD
jgi:hypothetical protein